MTFNINEFAEQIAEMGRGRMAEWEIDSPEDSSEIGWHMSDALVDIAKAMLPDFTPEECATILTKNPELWDFKMNSDFRSVRGFVWDVVRFNAVELARELTIPDVLTYVGKHFPSKLTSQERAILALMTQSAPAPRKGLAL